MSILPAMLLGIVNQEEICIKHVNYPEIHFQSIQDLPCLVDIELSIFCPKMYRYEIFELLKIKISKKDENKWEYQYSGILQCNDEMQYNKLKNAFKETEIFSENPANYSEYIYPQEKDKIFPNDYLTAKHEWTHYDNKEYSFFEKLASGYSLSFTSDRPSIYCLLEAKPIRQVFKEILQKDNLLGHPIFSADCNYLTLGNEFCPSLCPKFDQLITLMKKSLNEGLQITIAYPFLIQSQSEHFLKLLSLIDEFSRLHEVIIELTINDWGVLHIINEGEYPFIQPVLGRLLNKRQKDVRFQWKRKIENYEKHLQSNMLNEPLVTHFLQKNKVMRFNFETHPHINKINGFGHTLYFPFYQMNTSVYCQLQELNKKKSEVYTVGCSHPCENVIQVFPNHLKSAERGNTIFGFCDSFLQNPAFLQYYLSNGIDRLVYTVL